VDAILRGEIGKKRCQAGRIFKKTGDFGCVLRKISKKPRLMVNELWEKRKKPEIFRQNVLTVGVG
jgi:hypothetical protein